MHRRVTGVLGGAAAVALVAAFAPGAAQAAPQATDPQPNAAHKADDRPDPLEQQRRELRKQAVDQLVNGDATVQRRGPSNAIKVGSGKKTKWVEYGTQQTADILSFLVDFGDKQDPRTGTSGNWDGDASTPDTPFPAVDAGPVHNHIPEPDRATDNSTYWRPNFDRSHYMDMFFNGLPGQNGESFHGVYKEMSSGRFDVEGDVSDWVTVPYSEPSYGETETNQDMTRFIQDAANAWYDKQKAAGKTDAEISDYLKQFDQWDRFDYDGDGNFNEPDGYIDHFQAIHAGTGEEAGAPSWAIWSHRWAVNPSGTQGPDGGAHVGGIKIGNTNFFIRDYTTEPENGGLGVFSHEFGHDLGLPDYYDTSGGGENSTAFWTLMSSGSWMNHGGNSIGTTPNHMGPVEKLQLGWLDYDQVEPGQSKTVDLGPSYHATSRKQAVVVHLPDGTQTNNAGAGPSNGGAKYLFSGTQDDATTTVTSPAFTVPAGAQLTADTNFSTEKDWDYAYAEVSTDGGKTFTPIATNFSTDTNPNNQNDGHGITGSSGGWKPLTASLADYAGQQAQLRFRMFNDANTHGFGFKVDNIRVGDALSEDVEGGAPDWTRDGFRVVTNGTYQTSFSRYYLAENRQYGGYDSTLAQGPYNFGWAATRPSWVERYPYQNGLLVWYWNTGTTDNNTSQHPGFGEATPVDARPTALKWSDGTVARNRIQPFDATFGLNKTDPISLHREVVKDGQPVMTTLEVGKQNPVPVFDDTDPNAYYDANNPTGSVKVAGTGTTIRVLKENDTKDEMTVKVN